MVNAVIVNGKHDRVELNSPRTRHLNQAKVEVEEPTRALCWSQGGGGRFGFCDDSVAIDGSSSKVHATE